MTLVVIGFGTNLGDRMEHLRAAKRGLMEAGLSWVGESSVVESPPFGHAPDDIEAPWYLNAVACVETTQSPEDLLVLFRALEAREGRVERDSTDPFYHSRPLDVDLLFYGDAVIHNESVVVPHPRLELRRFVIDPLAELLPHFVHPVLKQSMRTLAEACQDSTKVRRVASSFDVL